MSDNGPCNAASEYVLFATGSTNATREWARGSAMDYCTKRSQEKLKYHVLKHPPSTAPNPPSRTQGSNSRTVLSLAQLKTVKLGDRIYSVDPAIYEALTASLKTSPVLTACELKTRIDQVRIQTGIPAPIEIQLANVGLGNYLKRYTYQSAGSKTYTTSKTKASPTRTFNDYLRTSEYARDVMVDFDIIKKVISWKTVRGLKIEIETPFTETISIKLIGTDSWKEFAQQYEDDLLGIYPGKTFRYIDAQFIEIVKNDGCDYTGDISNMFPGGSASLFGTRVLTADATAKFFKSGQKSFTLFSCKLTPTVNASKGGTLLSKTGILAAYGKQIIFVPAETELETIQCIKWPEGVGLTI